MIRATTISNQRRLPLPAACVLAIGWFAFAVAGRAQPPEAVRRQAEPTETACDRCHSCAEPVPGSSCLRPCTRAERLRIEREFSAKLGPSTVLLDELEELYLPVAFDHKGHAEMGQMAGGCATCHHYTPEGSEHPACKTCHEITAGQGSIRRPGLKGAYHRQCLSCHREWSGETGCGVCHRPKAAARRMAATQRVPTVDDLVGRMHPPIPEPDVKTYVTQREDHPATNVLFRHKDHAHRYGIRCAECHQEDNCNRCHDADARQTKRVRTLEDHHKPCMSCHRSDTCESCHYEVGRSAPPPFDHVRTGWPLAEYHREKSCRACHSTVPFTKVDRSCAACHRNWNPTTFDHAVTGQVLDENHVRVDCDACHIERRFDRAPTCDGCHEESEGVSFPAKQPGPSRKIAPSAAPEP